MVFLNLNSPPSSVEEGGGQDCDPRELPREPELGGAGVKFCSVCGMGRSEPGACAETAVAQPEVYRLKPLAQSWGHGLGEPEVGVDP